MTIQITHIRESFHEIISLLSDSNIDYWVGRGLLEQIDSGIIDDDEVNHDIDFHILKTEKQKLKNILEKKNYTKIDDRDYKIQINAKCDGRRIEFVFLEEDFSNSNQYLHRSKNIVYGCPKSVFGDHTLLVGSTTVKVPWPIKEYLSHCTQISS
ncbi:hypothetical protein JW796_00570 [Candidatus Dojkabacteria bacterium]|nr:hypothetical protein [Candidatus Dojkabacteria bacterium]